MHSIQDEILDSRRQLFNSYGDNLDDVCFLFFHCPTCESTQTDLTLLPIVDGDKLSIFEKKQVQNNVLKRILDSDFSFLNEKYFCDFDNSILKKNRIVYCCLRNGTDYHYYIDYPFTKIQEYKFSLLNEPSDFILFFDTETTGLPKKWNSSYKDIGNWPRLVQLSWIISDKKGEIYEKANYIIKPQGFEIPNEAVNVHKISTNYAKSNGHVLDIVLKEFNSKISSSKLLVGHNLNFDINVVAAELYRLNFDSDIISKKRFCTMENSINLCMIPGKYGYKYPSLTELYRFLFRKELIETHNASVDVFATYKCFFEINKNINSP